MKRSILATILLCLLLPGCDRLFSKIELRNHSAGSITDIRIHVAGNEFHVGELDKNSSKVIRYQAQKESGLKLDFHLAGNLENRSCETNAYITPNLENQFVVEFGADGACHITEVFPD